MTTPSIDTVLGIIADLENQVCKRVKSIELIKHGRKELQDIFLKSLEKDLVSLHADLARWKARLPQKVA